MRAHTAHARWRARRVRVALFALVLTAVSSSPSHGSTLSGAASVDDYDGPQGQWTRAALGLAGIAFGRGDVLGGGMRFDDAVVGGGYGVVAGGGVRLGGPTTLRFLVTRFLGDDGYRAWRVKAGPQWGLPRGSLAIYLVHDANNADTATESGSGELSVPVTSRLEGRLTGSYGRTAEVEGFAASAGAGWTAIPHLELGGDVGLARNPPSVSPGPSGGGPLDGMPGAGRKAHEDPTSSNQIGATAELFVRVSFP